MQCLSIIFLVLYIINYRTITAQVSYATLKTNENDELQPKDCESIGDISTEDRFDIDNVQMCPEKYVMFNGTCKECDCGEANCELDANGTKIDCNCSSTQKEFKGKCVTCMCGELSRLCYFDYKGGKQCVCLAGAADRLGTCTACSCGANSRSCLFNKEGGLVCYCKLGYAQRNDTCYESCKTSRDCFNGGLCKKQDGAQHSFCECPADFSGGRCQIDKVCDAMQLQCDSIGAVCRRDGSRRFCECQTGQRLNLVSGVCEDICDSTKCNNGFCIVKDLGFRCSCKQGYTGVFCDEKIEKFRENSPNYPVPIIIISIIFLAIVGFSIGAICLKRRNQNLLKTYQQQTQGIRHN